ncbi:MAG: hypothetical protein GX643_16685 [Acidimicrobiales bacterium]|nr:hypothetical protein [Acidimicrobiales bacterium]
MAVKGKWAQGIEPRNFRWVMKDVLGACERPGGYGANHRRVRRQEEIIWVREQGFAPVISIIPSPANLHNYDELGVSWLHRPFGNHDDQAAYLSAFLPELKGLITAKHKVLIHSEELGDRISGIVGAYLVWSRLMPSGPKAISLTEQLMQRQLGPLGRELVSVALSLPPAD